jgi:hypothetical protein
MEAAIEVDWAIAPSVVAASDDLGLEASQRQRTIGQNVHEVPDALTSHPGREATEVEQLAESPASLLERQHVDISKSPATAYRR